MNHQQEYGTFSVVLNLFYDILFLKFFYLLIYFFIFYLLFIYFFICLFFLCFSLFTEYKISFFDEHEEFFHMKKLLFLMNVRNFEALLAQSKTTYKETALLNFKCISSTYQTFDKDLQMK